MLHGKSKQNKEPLLVTSESVTDFYSVKLSYVVPSTFTQETKVYCRAGEAELKFYSE